MNRNYPPFPHFNVPELPNRDVESSENSMTKPHRHSRSLSPESFRKYFKCDPQSQVKAQCPVHGLQSFSNHGKVQSYSSYSQGDDEVDIEEDHCVCSCHLAADSSTVEYESEVNSSYSNLPTSISMHDLRCTEDIGFFSISSQKSLCHCASRQKAEFDAECSGLHPCYHNAVIPDSSSSVSSSENDVMKCRLSDLLESNDRTATSYFRRPVQDPCIIRDDVRELVKSFLDAATAGYIHDSGTDSNIKFVINNYMPCVGQAIIQKRSNESSNQDLIQPFSHRVRSCPPATIREVSTPSNSSQSDKITLNEIDEVEVRESTEILITEKTHPAEIAPKSNYLTTQQVCHPESEQQKKSLQSYNRRTETRPSSKHDICQQCQSTPEKKENIFSIPVQYEMPKTRLHPPCNSEVMKPPKEISYRPCKNESYTKIPTPCKNEKPPLTNPCDVSTQVSFRDRQEFYNKNAQVDNPYGIIKFLSKSCENKVDVSYHTSDQDQQIVKSCDVCGNAIWNKEGQLSNSKQYVNELKDSKQVPCLKSTLSPKPCVKASKQQSCKENKEMRKFLDRQNAEPNQPYCNTDRQTTEQVPRQTNTRDQSPCGRYRDMFGPISCRTAEKPEKSLCGKDKQMFGPISCGKNKQTLICDKDVRSQPSPDKHSHIVTSSPCFKEKPCETRKILEPCQVRQQRPFAKPECRISVENSVTKTAQPCNKEQNRKPNGVTEELRKPCPCVQQKKRKSQPCGFCEFYEDVKITKPQICDWEQKINMALTDIVEFKEEVEEFDESLTVPVFRSKQEQISSVERSYPCQESTRSKTNRIPCECRHEKIVREISPSSLAQERHGSYSCNYHNETEMAQRHYQEQHQLQRIHHQSRKHESRTQSKNKKKIHQVIRSSTLQAEEVCSEQEKQIKETCGCGREPVKSFQTNQPPENRIGSSDSDDSQPRRYSHKARSRVRGRPCSSTEEIHTCQPAPSNDSSKDPNIEYQYHKSDRRKYIYKQTVLVRKPKPCNPCKGEHILPWRDETVLSNQAPCTCSYERKTLELKPCSNREGLRLHSSEIEDYGCKGDDDGSISEGSHSSHIPKLSRSNKKDILKEGSSIVKSCDEVTLISSNSISCHPPLTVPVCSSCVSDKETSSLNSDSTTPIVPCCDECLSCKHQQSATPVALSYDAYFKPISCEEELENKDSLASSDRKFEVLNSNYASRSINRVSKHNEASNIIRPCSSCIVQPCPNSRTNATISSIKLVNKEMLCPDIVSESTTSDLCDEDNSPTSSPPATTKRRWFPRGIFWKREPEEIEKSYNSEPTYSKDKSSTTKTFPKSSRSTGQRCSVESYSPCKYEEASFQSPTSSSTCPPCQGDEEPTDEMESEESSLPSPPQLECLRASHPTEMRTQIVLVFSTEMPVVTIAWLMKRLQDPVGEEGGQLQVKLVPKHSHWPPMLHIGAHDLRMLQAAEMQELIKRDKNGCIQYFALENVERFMNEAKHLPSVLTPAEKQRVVYKILMKEVHVQPCEKTLPGKCNVKLFPGHSIVQVCKQQGLITHIFALHDPVALKKVRKGWLHIIYSDKRLDEIRTYYGESIVVFLTFTALFTLFLVIPALVAINMLLFNSLPKIDNQYFLVVVVSNVLVIIGMLVLWHRRCGSLAACWGAPMRKRPPSPRENFAGSSIALHQATGRYEPSYPAWKRTGFMLFVSYPFVVLMLVCAVLFTNGFYYNRKDYIYKAPENITWHDTFVDIGKVILFSTFVFILVKILDYSATLLTEWENHRTEAEFNSHRVFKIVILAYIWNFYGFYYALFYLNAFQLLVKDLSWFVATSLFLNILTKGVIPYLRLHFFSKPRRGSRFRESVVPGSSRETLCAQVHCSQESYDEQMKCLSTTDGFTKDKDVTRADDELDLQPYTGEYTDYLDKLVHFGYAFLFTSLAPLTVLLVILHNILHIMINEFRLGSLFQRPIVIPTYCMGKEWQEALRVVGVLAMMTNISLLFYSDYLRQIIPFEITDRYWILFLVLMEHLVIAFYFILDILILSLPCSNCLGKEKLCHEIRQQERQAKFYRMQGYLCNLTKHSCSMTRYPGLAVQQNKLKKKKTIE